MKDKGANFQLGMDNVNLNDWVSGIIKNLNYNPIRRP